MKLKTKAKPNLKENCKWWGIGLIVAGIILIYFTSMIVGAVLLMLGVVSLVIRKDWNLAIIGAIIILWGEANLMSAMMIEEHFPYIALLQILIGVYALIQYYESDEKEVSGKKKIAIIGIVLLALIVLVSTFFSEATISTEEARLESYGEYFTSNDSIYSAYFLNKGLESGTYSLEYAYNQLSEIENGVNECERKINEALKYSLVTYTGWGGVSKREEYERIYPESYRGSLDLERDLIEAGVFTNKCLDTTGCENGWCKVEGTNYCCPRRNMEIVNGRCSSISTTIK
ncbi:hypothetical protein J4233_00315 [Candidatus Pacearchaeota archaeon]|nr:hypothetical protein [Candidatus Pacearchaeota archaeon]